MIHSLFNFSNFFVDSFHRFFVSSDGILRFSFLSKIDFEFWIVQFPEAGRTWILCRIAFDISVLSFDRIQFPGAGRRTTREWLLLLQRLPIAPECHLRRRSRLRVFRIVFDFRSENYSVDVTCRHRIARIAILDLVFELLTFLVYCCFCIRNFHRFVA